MEQTVVYGFCIVEDNDVPVDGGRQCLTDRSFCIPVSWGSHTQQWMNGAWQPEIPRPENYVYAPKAWAQTVVAVPKRTTSSKEKSTPWKTPLVPVRSVKETPLARTRTEPLITASRFARPTMAEQGKVCIVCKTGDRPHRSRGVCTYCHQTAKRRAAGMKPNRPHEVMIPIPCPVCATLFKPRMKHDGTRQKYCSVPCVRQVQRSRAR